MNERGVLRYWTWSTSREALTRLDALVAGWPARNGRKATRSSVLREMVLNAVTPKE